MPVYLIQYSYTAEAWRALVTGTTERDRHRAVEPLLRQCDGRFPRLVFDGEPPIEIRDKFVAFGESDVVAFVYFPDNEHAAAFAMSVMAGGAVQSFKTTPLLSLEDAIRAMDVAGRAFPAYTPPQRKP